MRIVIAVALSVGLLASQAALAQSFVADARLTVRLNFGGPARSSGLEVAARYQPGPMRSRPAEDIGTLAPGPALELAHFGASLDKGSMFRLFGAPVARWGGEMPEGMLQATETHQRSWFARNWWLVGLGAIAVGVAAAAGEDALQDETAGNGSGNQTNCGVSGDVVGPEDLEVDTDCGP